jgi:uncharacterized protein (TIGR00369 family)
LALRQARVTETARGKVGIEEEKEMNDSVKGFEQADRAREGFPAPIGRLLGLTIIRSGIGRATVEFEATGRFANPMGTLHGGVLCDVADARNGRCYRNTLAEGETFTTIELKINFIRPVWKATLRAEAKVVHAGKTVGLVECDIVDEQERLIARASSTCMTLHGRLAEGRQFPGESIRQAEAMGLVWEISGDHGCVSRRNRNRSGPIPFAADFCNYHTCFPSISLRSLSRMPHIDSMRTEI